LFNKHDDDDDDDDNDDDDLASNSQHSCQVSSAPGGILSVGLKSGHYLYRWLTHSSWQRSLGNAAIYLSRYHGDSLRSTETGDTRWCSRLNKSSHDTALAFCALVVIIAVQTRVSSTTK